MEIFLDTASSADVKKYSAFIDGVTTNPSLVAKEDRKINDIVRDILVHISGQLSVEVNSESYEDMMSEAKGYRKFLRPTFRKTSFLHFRLQTVPVYRIPEILNICNFYHNFNNSINIQQISDYCNKKSYSCTKK